MRCKHVPSLTKHESFKYNCSHMIVSYSIFNVLRISNHLYIKYTHLTKSVNILEISIIEIKANLSFLFAKQTVLLSYIPDTYNIVTKIKWNVLP